MRGLNIPLSCPLGCNEVESIIHILRDCPQARAFWDSFSPPLPPNILYGTNLLDWLRINCTSHQRSSSNIPWSYLFPFGSWCLWLRRNRVIFRESSTCKSLMEETISKVDEFAFLGVNERARCPQNIIQVWWFSPPERWFKLNTDGSSLGNPSRARGGEIIRNSHGEWVSGFARAIEYTTSVAAELWALQDGINLCIDLNLTNVIIELDAKLVIDLLQNEDGRKNDNEVIIVDCREGLKKIPSVRIQHIFREANMCADALTRRGAFLSHNFVIF